MWRRTGCRAVDGDSSAGRVHHDRRNDHDIFGALAERLGIAEAFTEGRSPSQWLRHIYEPTGRALVAQGIDAPDFDRSRKTTS
jgi:hypothetical protein